MYFNTFTIPSIDLYAVNRPGDGLAQRFPQHRPAGLSDGRQTLKCPLTRTVLPQLTHKHTVGKQDHMHVPSLAPAASKLTVAHTQMLLAVPMEALRPTPTAAINAEYTTDLPKSTIGNEYLNRFSILVFIPQHNDLQLVINRLYTNRLGEKPLLMFANDYGLAVVLSDLSGQFVGFDKLAVENHFAIEFQVCDIASAFGIDMVEILAMSKPAIKSEIARDAVLDNPIDKLPEKDIVVLELGRLLKALLFLDKASELKGIMFSRSADIIGNKVAVGNLETLLGMIPERADILDKLAAAVNKNVINGSMGLSEAN